MNKGKIKEENTNFLESISVLEILKNCLTLSLPECNGKENENVE